ncbi:MAG: hypothetical protein JGK17_10905 [Microcoleus sp. PH2017_10_PVI_O_A]|uniref:hypothetical protein n=1 Tax=unclassified Microcoleus TaxID=2642155 RepID=UPI001DFF4A9A|nr:MULTISPECIES: hypothetical protein [unclassified Microcoleus]TAE82864.1 MAG: hypothetical protein EAZ83_10635 [Oscillatoriales cyanobacterium]MCC3406080.1 hypothetical protein [Microcoleus sp. PH2017_10_PVI_O_A]MCC3463817.1 hypothetical protein [Microcoleus sp. PH2017_11_PCY_U_A]MCC3482155.1 hypothetical protein [Microcoleus sp. PH2017_12_PCY_D_A]MCC3529376.1 hypothetical protein [Microcoleus sp. PH2017_21_RUC_O_A]
MSNLVQRLEITAHPQLEKSLGYQGNSRWVAWRWEPDIDQLISSDSKTVSTGNNMAWLVFLQHDLVQPALQEYNFGEGDRYWLLLDTETRNLYVGEGKAVQSLLEQPESLALLACLDGGNAGQTAETWQQTLSKLTPKTAFRHLTNVIPFGIAAALIGALGVGTGLWVVPTVQQKLAEKTTFTSPISSAANCGIGGSDDFSAYVGSSTGDKELHLIGVYEANAEHGKVNLSKSALAKPSKRIEIKVERRNKPIILALSAYEPVNWNVTVEPGAVIEKIIVNGYHNQTVSGVSGIPIEEHSYEETGKYLGDFIYKWAATPESTDTASLVTKLEEINRTKLTSFQGCYRGTNFSIK